MLWILLEENAKPVVETQRILNPKMKEMVKVEILKWLDAGIIFSISDSIWIFPIHVVPKNGGIIILCGKNDEMIPSRVVVGWRVCIDYRKLNAAIRNDHFFLPFLDKILERLAEYDFYCFLDCFSGYNQIIIAPKKSRENHIYLSLGTFTLRKMSFGLCNGLAIFQRYTMAIFSILVRKSWKYLWMTSLYLNLLMIIVLTI